MYRAAEKHNLHKETSSATQKEALAPEIAAAQVKYTEKEMGCTPIVATPGGVWPLLVFGEWSQNVCLAIIYIHMNGNIGKFIS